MFSVNKIIQQWCHLVESPKSETLSTKQNQNLNFKLSEVINR